MQCSAATSPAARGAHRPVTMQRLLELRRQHPEARLIVGHTEVGIERKYQQTMPDMLLAASRVPELTEIKVCGPYRFYCSPSFELLGLLMALAAAAAPCFATAGLQESVSVQRHVEAQHHKVAGRCGWHALWRCCYPQRGPQPVPEAVHRQEAAQHGRPGCAGSPAGPLVWQSGATRFYCPRHP